MTISSTVRIAGPYIGTGSVSVYAFAFKVFQASDVLVQQTDTNGNITTLVLTTNYSVALNSDQNANPGGSINLAAPLPANYRLIISSQVQELQSTSITNNGGFYPKVIENSLDYATILIQQLQAQLNQCLQLPLAVQNVSLSLPTPQGNQLLGWNAAGTALVNTSPTGVGAGTITGGAAGAGGNIAANTITDTNISATAGIQSSKLSYTAPYTGGVSRLVRTKLAEISINVNDFGADPTGAADSATAINAAIAAVTSLGGGFVDFGVGLYKIGSTLTVNTDGVKLRGMGRGSPHDTSPEFNAPTRISWSGVSGGTMIAVAPGVSATSSLKNCSVTGVQLLGNSLAAYGLSVTSCSDSMFEITGGGCNTSLMFFTCSGTLSEASDCQNNDIWVRGFQKNSTDGSIFICDAPTASTGPQGNFSANRVWEIAGDHYGIGAQIKGADNNDFYSIGLFRVSGSGNYGVTLTMSASQASRANAFYRCAYGSGGFYSTGTEVGAYPSVNNNIMFVDVENGDPAPTIGTASNLWWGTNHAPIGLQQALGTSANKYPVVYSDGRTRYSGISGSIAAGGSATITFPTAFKSAAISANCTAQLFSATTAVTCGIAVTTTGITIYNTSSQANSFFWEAEGI